MSGTPPASLTAALADRYRIERELGAGGMATVYLADDLKHDRKVALKVLKPELAAVIGAERFVVEIKTTAALQHPHILPLFDSGTAEGFLFYVMPFIDGETLRTKLDREHQLGIEEAVKITTEVADALDYAHRRGVIHRDIKPENILLHDGRPMVADFGIALALSAAAGGRMTETGMSLGTPHYMSPEQATAEKDLTGRSDIYSLASVLYEMLAGDPPHTGATAQQIIMKIVTDTARPITELRRSVPPNIAWALAKALEKLPADRFATAAEFAAALRDPKATVATTGYRPAVAQTRRGWTVTAAVAVVTLLVGWFVGAHRREPGSVPPTSVMRVSLALGDSAAVRAIGSARLAISPAGDRVVYIGPDGTGTALWVRALDQPAAHPLPDTKGAFAPFFSPDGSEVGFFTSESGTTLLKVIPVVGGVARTVVSDSVAQYGGGDWGDDGQIYFTSIARGLARVAPSGGRVTQISIPDTLSHVSEHDFPDVLPGSRYAAVMLWKGSIGSNHIGLVDLRSGAVTDLTTGTFAHYVAPGYLAIGTGDGKLLAAPIDVRKGRLLGTPVLVIGDVQQENANGTVQFAASATGTLVYQAQTTATDGLLWVDRAGRVTNVDSTLRGSFLQVALSPDGRQIAIARNVAGESQIWVKQLTTGAFNRLSFDVTNSDRPVWYPDGQRVAFLATRNNVRGVWGRRADGSDSVTPLSPPGLRLDEVALDPLGRYRVFRTEGGGLGSRRLLILRAGVDSVAHPLVASQFDNYAMTISPDGNWIAYASNESGHSDVYVRPFPSVDSARFAISASGGMEPMWRRDGKELFFRNARGDMYAVPVTTGRHFTHGSPTVLFSHPGLATQEFHRAYDVHPDGKRFLMLSSGGGDTPVLNLIFNWPNELAGLKASTP